MSFAYFALMRTTEGWMVTTMPLIAVYPAIPKATTVVCPLCGGFDDWLYDWGWEGELGPPCSSGCWWYGRSGKPEPVRMRRHRAPVVLYRPAFAAPLLRILWAMGDLDGQVEEASPAARGTIPPALRGVWPPPPPGWSRAARPERSPAEAGEAGRRRNVEEVEKAVGIWPDGLAMLEQVVLERELRRRSGPATEPATPQADLVRVVVCVRAGCRTISQREDPPVYLGRPICQGCGHRAVYGGLLILNPLNGAQLYDAIRGVLQREGWLQ